MPMSKDTQGGGTEGDGSRNPMYCSHCYAGGKFTRPEMTVDEMRDLVRGKLKEMHIPGFLAYFFIRKIPGLRRWSGGPA
jgi:hypothetical protein